MKSTIVTWEQGEQAAAFLEHACTRFALSENECGDFITYWLPALQRDGHSLVEFVATDRYARMRVGPKPDTTIRLFTLFRRSQPNIKAGAPELPQLHRKGFAVTEWGDADLDERPHPFAEPGDPRSGRSAIRHARRAHAPAMTRDHADAYKLATSGTSL